MTARCVAPKLPGMTRIKKFTENMAARFRPGTFARIDAKLGVGEDRAEFVRTAVEELLRVREHRKVPDGGESD